jgi:hypothetical protein
MVSGKAAIVSGKAAIVSGKAAIVSGKAAIVSGKAAIVSGKAAIRSSFCSLMFVCNALTAALYTLKAGKRVRGARFLRASDRLQQVNGQDVLNLRWHQIMDILKSVGLGEKQLQAEASRR